MARDDLFEPSFDPETATTLRAKLSARDAEIAQLKEELANARAALTPDSPGTKDMSWKGAAHYWNRVSSERGIEINKLRVELASARAAVEMWQREYSGALADFEHASAELVVMKGRTAWDVNVKEHENASPAAPKVSTYMDRLEAKSSTDGGAQTALPAPPEADPRVAALCVVVDLLATREWPVSGRDKLPGTWYAALETIKGRR